jgi:hypothetical protein
LPWAHARFSRAIRVVLRVFNEELDRKSGTHAWIEQRI